MPQNSKSGPFDALSNNDGPRVHTVRAMAADMRCAWGQQARERFPGAVEACILFQWGPPMRRRGDDAELFNATGVLGRRMDNQRGEKEGGERAATLTCVGLRGNKPGTPPNLGPARRLAVPQLPPPWHQHAASRGLGGVRERSAGSKK